MKNQIKRSLSCLIVVVTVVTAVLGSSVQSSAATYVYNWGTREVVCTELSDAAKSFYSGIYVFDDMSKSQGGTGTSNAYSSALYKELKALMTNEHSHINAYKEANTLLKYTDCQNGGGKISSFYSGKEIGPGWDSAATWNKEHTWPNSKGLGGSDENDIMMLRPTSVSENSGRGNTAYGQSSGYYNPNRESNGKYDLRGDVSRIVLYVYVRWGNTSYMWGKSGVMESLDVLLDWMEADPVDTWEMGRNDAVQSITGTRNVFVDYPEYAWLLFGEEVPSDMATPSGKASNGNFPDTKPDTPDTKPDTPDTPIVTPPSQSGCDHTQTEVRGAIPAGCFSDGFSGNTYCLECEEEIESGYIIVAIGEHTMVTVGSGDDAREECAVCGFTAAAEPDGFIGWLTSLFARIAEFFASLFS